MGWIVEKTHHVYVKKGTKRKRFKTIIVPKGLGAPGFITLEQRSNGAFHRTAANSKLQTFV